MLFAAWATTSPTTARTRSSQSMLTAPVSRAAPTASSAPINPDVAVIEKTAARVITSHLLTASGRVIPSGRLAVFSTYRQVAKRPTGGGAVVAAAALGVGAMTGLVAMAGSGSDGSWVRSRNVPLNVST